MVSGKKIVEVVPGWLRVFEDGTVDRTWTGPTEAEFMTKPVPPHEDFIDGVAVRDVAIDPNQGFAVRIYIPERNRDIQDQEKLPIILHFHGGGFCISRPDWFMYYNFYTKLVRSAQVVCVSVFLRLAPEYRLPTACKDGFAAFLWLMSVALGECPEPWLDNFADFGRVFLIGDSTGGNIVHHVAARAGAMNTEPVKLAGGIAIHPGFQRAEPSKSFLELPETPLLTRDMISKFMALALPKGCTMDHPIICPMGPDAPSLAGLKLPPMMVVVAEKDLLRDTELEYCEAMKEAGKEVEVLINEGMGHSFYFDKIAVDNDPETADQTTKLIEGIKSFIDRH
ncbi:carboxylesterase 15 [Tripterygium wilfordii]|uniref:Carboxylesterase 15 n=2 Tax=Tripterygium wilfordii TaxID=458696 RepID=A0A7J7DW14_TRIWF|nr:carboxylesterase 15 [Tripterygium wilfordii]